MFGRLISAVGLRQCLSHLSTSTGPISIGISARQSSVFSGGGQKQPNMAPHLAASGIFGDEQVEEDSRIEKEIPSASQEGQQKQRYSYTEHKLKDLNFDVYPYRIERNWRTEGKRCNFWADWGMKRDVRNRELVAKWGPDRMRFKALKTNNILPWALRDEFRDALRNMPKNAHPKLIRNLCAFTGRRRGKFTKFRLNRHIFRQLADKAQLCGIQRGIW